MATSEDAVSVDVDISDGRTTITVAGEQNASVIVRSASGERVYLPPEQEELTDDTAYQSPEEGDSPYEGIPTDSPYDAAHQQPTLAELTPTANGFRIVHPEPVTDFRFLR